MSDIDDLEDKGPEEERPDDGHKDDATGGDQDQQYATEGEGENPGPDEAPPEGGEPEAS